MKSLLTWTEWRLVRLFRKLSNRQNFYLKAEMFSFHSKYFVYRELKRAPQKLSFCFKCPDTGTVRILDNILYPWCKNTRFGCILTNATTEVKNPICFFYFVSSGEKSKLGEGLEGRINTIPDEEFRERNGALRIQQETDEKGTMFSLP